MWSRAVSRSREWRRQTEGSGLGLRSVAGKEWFSGRLAGRVLIGFGSGWGLGVWEWTVGVGWVRESGNRLLFVKEKFVFLSGARIGFFRLFAIWCPKTYFSSNFDIPKF